MIAIDKAVKSTDKPRSILIDIEPNKRRQSTGKPDEKHRQTSIELLLFSIPTGKRPNKREDIPAKNIKKTAGKPTKNRPKRQGKPAGKPSIFAVFQAKITILFCRQGGGRGGSPLQG